MSRSVLIAVIVMVALGLIWKGPFRGAHDDILPSVSNQGSFSPVEPLPPEPPTKAEELRAPLPAPVGDLGARRVALASSTAAPVMTLVGHLTARISELPWGNGKDYEELTSASKTATGVAASKKYNPTGKRLTTEEYDQLDALVKNFALKYEPLVIGERRLRKEASLRAIEAGRVESVVCPPHPGPFNPAGAAAHADIVRKAGQQLEQIVGQRLGVSRNDWFHSVTATSAPDGVNRQNSVYFSRAQEPEFFAMREAKETCQNEMTRAFTEFFRR